MINVLTLNQVESEKSREKIFQVLIDDTPLLDLFRDYEQQYSGTINGAYTDALSEHALSPSLVTNGARFMPLGCDCGTFECWFVTGQVQMFDNFVCWGQWANPYRDKTATQKGYQHWDYKRFPALVFDQQQYLSTIESALASIGGK